MEETVKTLRKLKLESTTCVKLEKGQPHVYIKDKGEVHWQKVESKIWQQKQPNKSNTLNKKKVRKRLQKASKRIERTTTKMWDHQATLKLKISQVKTQ